MEHFALKDDGWLLNGKVLHVECKFEFSVFVETSTNKDDAVPYYMSKYVLALSVSDGRAYMPRHGP